MNEVDFFLYNCVILYTGISTNLAGSWSTHYHPHYYPTNQHTPDGHNPATNTLPTTAIVAHTLTHH